jgi:hypothetical protein
MMDKPSEYAAGFIAGEKAERSAVVRYLSNVLLFDRAKLIDRGDHKQ